MTPQTARAPVLPGPYDLLVVGGGINGVAIARDAALRGRSVLLVEKGDFGSGTSSASSKMVHGGIRYLEQFRFGLVFEALIERHRLLRLAPHLVRPQSFLIPVYRDMRRGARLIRIGLFLYDTLALGRRLGKSVYLDAAATLARCPRLLPDGLIGGGIYWDGVMDDARLCLVNAIAASEESRTGVTTTIRNYTELVELRAGAPARARVREEQSVLAHRVVRALGPWSEPELLVPSKGVHVVLPRLPLSDGLLLTHSRDGRVFFVIPSGESTVVGTTETPTSQPPEALRVESAEVDYLLAELNRLFPGLNVSRASITGTFAGIRPLARRAGRSRAGSAGAVSRTHRIVESDGVLTVVGGKYTTYRAIARAVVDRLYPSTRCETARRALPGGEHGDWTRARARFGARIERYGEEEVARLFRRYGARLEHVLALVDRRPELGERLGEGFPELRAEVVHAARSELAVYAADFLRRRTDLRFREGGGVALYDEVDELLRQAGAPLPRNGHRAREQYLEEIAWEDRLRTTGALSRSE